MSEVRRLSNRSSFRKVDHLTAQNSSKNKKSKLKSKGRSQSMSKDCSESSLIVAKAGSLSHIHNSDIDNYFKELCHAPSSKLDYESPKINVRPENYFKGAKAMYKLDKPISHQAKCNISSTITNLIKEKQQKHPPLTVANDLNYKFKSLNELKPLLRKFIADKMDAKSLPPKASTRYVYNRVDQLLAQENQFLGNDSIDLSFDGKALNKNDILRIVDSFSVAFEDENDEDDEQYIKQPKNILPREVTGVF